MSGRIALKVDVDTLRGTLEGVPALLRLFERHRVGATFLFSLGPDHTGRALRRIFRPGFFSKVSRTSVVEHYGIQTLLYGTLLPGPDIGGRCGQTMRDVRDAGFEVGVHCWDHVEWQDFVAGRDAAWTEREMQLACARFREVFGTDTHPFLPVWNGEPVGCPQVPTTLPTLDELIGLQSDPVQHLLLASDGRDHVFTAHAELEGGKLIGLFERLLEGWKTRGYELISTDKMPLGKLPRHEVIYGEVPGRSGTLALQGKEVSL
jgi:undecaprenyl phosphate-alpha-L-ara4FN deformylase